MTERLDRNTESRDTAVVHALRWTKDDVEFLMSFWPEANGPDDEAEVARALGRTIEACRQFFYEERAGKHDEHPTFREDRRGPVRKHTRTTTTTTTTVTEYIGHYDEPEDRFWLPQQER
jgi:hypothetical protein